MKLTTIAIEKADTLTTRLRLALALNVTERWIIALLKENKDNSALTTAAALKVIREETKLRDSQILDDVSQPVRA